MKDQSRAPYFDSLKRYLEERNLTFHVPGHQQGRGAPPEFTQLLREHALACDITEVLGIDDIHAPHDQCRQAQELAAELYGAGHTYFLVNGSTVGNQAMFLATVGPADTVLLPQGSHRSAFAALLLSGARAFTFPTDLHPELLCLLPPTPEQLVEAHKRCPEARAFFFTSPTYHGAQGETEALIAAARERGLLVLLDAAWGAHLRAPQADLVVQSTHKLAPALTQAAMLHLNGERVDKARLEVALRHLQTSSPSSLIVASLDCARRYLALHGNEWRDRLASLSARALRKVNGLPGYACYSLDDPTRIIISSSHHSGYDLASALRYGRGVQVEMAEPHQVLLVLTPGHNEDDIDALVRALATLPKAARKFDFRELRESYQVEYAAGAELTVREAFFSPKRAVSLEDSVDRISAELLYCYPPGVPTVYPGQRFTAAKVEQIKTQRRLGGSVQGGSDPTLETVLIVKDRDD